jgi:hypothetical protein
VIGIYELAAESDEAYYAEVEDFINNRTWGNLATTILASSDTLKKNKAQVEHLANQLRIQAIGVNVWGGVIVLFPQLRWGGYPGNKPEDIQSGVGHVGNSWMLDRINKIVLWSPTISPVHMLPPTSPQAILKVDYRLTMFTVYPTVWNMMKVLSAGLAGI